MSPSLILLGAQIKLRKRHLAEWESLIINQQQVWQSIREVNKKMLLVCGDDKVGCFYLKKEQSKRLINTMNRQRQERGQMLVRHQQDLFLLDQNIETLKKST